MEPPASAEPLINFVESPTMKDLKPSGIDWKNPPESSGVYMKVSLTALHKDAGPVVFAGDVVAFRHGPTHNKSVPALPIFLGFLLSVRKAALAFPRFRRELVDMVLGLPAHEDPSVQARRQADVDQAKAALQQAINALHRCRVEAVSRGEGYNPGSELIAELEAEHARL